MIYLGTLGRMIGLKCPSSQRLDASHEPTFKDTLEGRRIAFPKAGVPRRVWQNQLSDASTPSQVAAVMAFINREWGVGPFVFVSADAPVTNMLSPGAAACTNVENPSTVIGQGGPMLLPDGNWSGSSYLSPTPSLRMFFGARPASVTEPGERIPVPLSGPVTASAFVLGDSAYCELVFYDAADAVVLSVPSTITATSGTTVRSWVTAEVPASAASCRVIARSTVQGSRPALTWTSGLLDWADGQGCPKAVIHGASRDLVMASREPQGGRYSNLSFVISEVG